MFPPIPKTTGMKYIKDAYTGFITKCKFESIELDKRPANKVIIKRGILALTEEIICSEGVLFTL